MRIFRVPLALAVLTSAFAAPALTSGASPAVDEPQPVTKGEITIADRRMLSAGGWAWFLGPDGGAEAEGQAPATATHPRFGSNVDANDPNRDLAGGQSETAIAASGQRVMVGWNDISGFLEDDSTLRRGSLTGVGFSWDGAQTFRDLIGLPNNNRNQQWFGDPTIVAVDNSHFIVGSLYLPAWDPIDFCAGKLALAVSVGTVSANDVSFTNPIVAISGGGPCQQRSDFLDKPFMAYDPNTRTLAMSYTRFGFDPPEECGNGQIEVVKARVPANPSNLRHADFNGPFVIQPEEAPPDCNFFSQRAIVNQGSYPAVAPNGDIYVAWERNWISNLFNGRPFIYEMLARLPRGANRPDKKVTLTVNQKNATDEGGVKSLDSTEINGYSRFIGNDFPRITWNTARSEVVVVWNDASQQPLGDIYMKVLPPSLSGNATAPIRKLNDDNTYALQFLPAVSARANGTVCTSWYDRRLYGSDSATTDYFGECRATPGTNASDFRITTGATNWAFTGGLINPNFGDYTDNASSGNVTYFTWADGRIGVPQPFVDKR